MKWRMLDKTCQPDKDEEKMSNEERDESEANYEDEFLKFSGPMSEQVLNEADKAEPFISIKIETTYEHSAEHFCSKARVLIGERETAKCHKLQNKCKKLRESEKYDFRTERSTKVKQCYTEFERILGRRAIVLLERCALSSSALALTEYFTIEHESDDENSLSVETEGEKQKKISEKAEECVEHDADETLKFKQLEVTRQSETHAQCKEEPRECEGFNFVAEGERAKITHYCPEFDSILKRRAIVVLERCCASSSAASRAPLKGCMIKNEIDSEISFSTEIKEEMQNKVIETAAEDGLGGPDAEGKCRQVEDTRKIETCAQPNKCMATNAERLLARETQEHQKCLAADIESWGKRMVMKTPEQRKKHNAAVYENWRKRIENETPEQRKTRLTILAERMRKRKKNETPERQKRLAKQVEYKRTVKIGLERDQYPLAATERLSNVEDKTVEQREEHLVVVALEKMKKAIEEETPEVREQRRAALAECYKKARERETPEQCQKRVVGDTECWGNGKQKESQEHTQDPLAATARWNDGEDETVEQQREDHQVSMIEYMEKATERMFQQLKAFTESSIVINEDRPSSSHLREDAADVERCRKSMINKTPEQRQKHRAVVSENWGKKLERETPEQRQKRLAAKAEYRKKIMENETPEQRQKRLAKQAEYNRRHSVKVRLEREKRLAAGTTCVEHWSTLVETCAQQNKCMATNTERLLARETQECQKRHAANLEYMYWRKMIERETPEQCKKRLTVEAEWMRRRIERETERLAAKAESKRKCIDNETPEQRQKRLAKQAEYYRRRSVKVRLEREKRDTEEKKNSIERETTEQCQKRLEREAECMKIAKEDEIEIIFEAFPTNAESSREMPTQETAEQHEKHLAREAENNYQNFMTEETLERHSQHVAASTEKHNETIERKMLEQNENQAETYEKFTLKSHWEKKTLEQLKYFTTDIERNNISLYIQETDAQCRMRQAENNRRYVAGWRMKKAIEEETPEERKQRLAKKAEYRRRYMAEYRKRRKVQERETPEQRQKRWAKVADYMRGVKEKEMAEQNKKRVVDDTENREKRIEKESQEHDQYPLPATERWSNVEDKTVEQREERQVSMIEYMEKEIVREMYQQQCHLDFAESSSVITEDRPSSQDGNQNNNTLKSELMNEDKVEYSAQEGNMARIKSEESNEENLSSEYIKENYTFVKNETVNENVNRDFLLQHVVEDENKIKSEPVAAVEDEGDEIDIDFEAYCHFKPETGPYISW